MRTLIRFLYLVFVGCLRAFQRQWRRAQFATVGVKVGRDVGIDLDKDCELSIASGSSIGLGSLLVIKSQGDMLGKLRIGTNTAINEYNNIRAAGGTIEIGRNCQIAQFCSIIATNHTTETTDYMIRAPWNPEKAFVVIEDDVWIGANAVVLPGVKIGRGAVIGAGSVVTRDMPDYSICAGVPARVISLRTLHA